MFRYSGVLNRAACAAAIATGMLAVQTDPVRAQAGQQCAGLAFDQSGNGAFIVGAFNLVPGDTLNVNIFADAGVVTTITFLGQTFNVTGNGTLSLVAPNTGAFVSGVLDAISIGGPSRVQVSCTAANAGGAQNGAEQTLNEADGNTQQLASNARADVLVNEIPNAVPATQEELIAEADRLSEQLLVPGRNDPGKQEFVRSIIDETKPQLQVLIAEQQAEIDRLKAEAEATGKAFQDARQAAQQEVENRFRGRRAALVEELENLTGSGEAAEARDREIRIELAQLADQESAAEEQAANDVDELPKRTAEQLVELAESRLNDLLIQLDKIEDAEKKLLDFGAANFDGQPGGFRLSMHQGQRRNRLGFGWSLDGLRRSEKLARQQMRARLGVSNGGTAAGISTLPRLLADERLNAWLEGSWSFTNDNRTGVEGDANAIRLDGGLTYRIQARTALGAKFRYRAASSDRDDGSQTTDTSGIGGAVFAQIGIPGGAVLTPIVAYERTSTDLDLTAGGVTVSSTFISDVYTVGAGLSRRFGLGEYWVEPNAALSYVTAIRDDHVRSDGAAINGATVVQGTAVLGPTFGTHIKRPFDGVRRLDPTIGFNGVWTFRDGGNFVAANGTLVRPVRLSGTLSAGIGAQLDNGAHIRLTGSWSGIGSDVQGGSITARLTMPLY